MMLVPIGTDAPIYHFPWATIGIMIVNTLMFFGTLGLVPDLETYERCSFLMLEFDTINPLQWVTSNFMHADIVHLVGNMFFLWGFGLVVEGKLGWWKFLLVYLGIGLLESAFEQITMFLISDGTGGALGASGVIYGIMGMAVIWAPKNEMNCFLWLGVFSRMVNVTIVVFGSIYIFLQILGFVMGGFSMSSAALHLTGLAVGLPVGIALLKMDIVDCEGWDYFTEYYASYDERKLRRSRRRRERQVARDEEDKAARATQLDQIDKALRDALVAKNDMAACSLYKKFENESVSYTHLRAHETP